MCLVDLFSKKRKRRRKRRIGTNQIFSSVFMLGLQDKILTVCLVDLFFKKEKRKNILINFFIHKNNFLVNKKFIDEFSKNKKIHD